MSSYKRRLLLNEGVLTGMFGFFDRNPLLDAIHPYGLDVF